ncbi:phospholipid-transporting ATPase ABCA3-like [Dermacentor variabilis]|uniref:phospholipid-transporting ATPase ABCA3-like n=1 Tax=Dermacentor variabilis TaxID=34621 RepID=UPI003F5AEEF2
MVTGWTRCTTGIILVGGYDITTCTKDARESFGYCPENNILFDDLTVEEHLVFFAVMKGTPYDAVRLEVVTLLHDAGLMQHRSKLAANLSLGQQRRLCTSLAIVSKPKVIILDEPTVNMDPESRREMWELLLKVRRSCSVFLTTQHVDEVDVLADRVVIMANARIRCAGSPTFLKQRFGTGYRMLVNKTSRRCDVTAIESLLRKYAPKAKLTSNSDNEAVFILGQIVATHLIITMFKDLEQRSADLGIDSLGVTVTSLEDVLVRVGEEQHAHQQRAAATRKDENSVIEVQAMLGCMTSVFMEHYADTLESFPLTMLTTTIVQLLRLLPSFSYSRGMTKLLQLASENSICRIGGQVLESACHAKVSEARLSLQRCCAHVTESDPAQYAITPLEVHPYSVFNEVLTLVIEGPVLFVLLVLADCYWLRRLDQQLSAPGSSDDHLPQPVARGLVARGVVTQVHRTLGFYPSSDHGSNVNDRTYLHHSPIIKHERNSLRSSFAPPSGSNASLA